MSIIAHDTSRQQREALVDGLRQLAEFYRQHPDVPQPWCPRIAHYPITPGEVERVAAALGVPAIHDRDGSCQVEAHFGGVTLAVIYVCDERMARARAEMSYTGSVEPDPPHLVEPAPVADPALSKAA